MKASKTDIEHYEKLAKDRGGESRTHNVVTQKEALEERFHEARIDGAMTLALPWPPQVNNYYTVVVIKKRPRKILTAEGRAYKKAVCTLLAGVRKMSGRLAVSILAQPKDNRKRDLDNILKSLLDALKEAGVYGDDSQIDDLRVVRCKKSKFGHVIVTISQAKPSP